MALDAVVDEYAPVMETLAEQVDEIEQELLFSTERHDESVGELEDQLFGLKNQLTKLRRVIMPQMSNMGVLSNNSDELVPTNSRKYFEDVRTHLQRVVDSIDSMREHLTAISEAYTTRATRQINQDLKKLTAISTFFLPFAFVSGLYGMNFVGMPELHYKYGYFIVLGVFVILAFFMLRYLRRSKMI